MYRLTVTIAICLLIGAIAVGCSGGSNVGNTTTPDLTTNESKSAEGLKALWGYYDLYFDFDANKVEAVTNRSVMFNANVVQFLNGSGGISFPSLTTDVQETYVGVDIDVAITHPLPDPAYNGYDVMGVFIGDGGGTLTSTGVAYAVNGTDQTLTNADGYTRWFNPTEFAVPGVLGYTAGALATPGYNGSATINGYKLYADELGADDDAYTFVSTGDGPGNNVFSASTTNTRNYLLQFPIPDPNVVYNYAVVARWDGEDVHPANTDEVVAAATEVTPDIYYVDGTSNGGDLILDINLAGYGAQPSNIIIESSVLSGPNSFLATAVNTGGDALTSSYHVEVTADNITGTEGQEFFVIADYGGYNYGNDLGVPNDAEAENLAAYFRYSLFVSDVPYNAAPEITSGVDGEDAPFFANTEQYSVTATDGDGDPLTYAFDLYNDQSASYEFQDDPGNNDGTIDINWGLYANADGDSFVVSCTVSDGTDETDATDLAVTASTVIYHFDGNAGNGGMTNYSGGTGPNWSFISNYWEENGNASNFTVGQCKDLLTPAFNVPAGITNVIISVKHSGNTGMYFGCYAQAAGHYGYTTNGGTNVTYHSNPGNMNASAIWLNFVSGTNFQYSGPCGNLGGYFQACRNIIYYANWTSPAVCNGGTVWGSIGSPVTSTYSTTTLNGVNNVQLAYLFTSSSFGFGGESGTGWQIFDIKVTATP